MKYDRHKKTAEPKAQTFDINYEIEKCGKKYNLYQSIQEAREDTEIYPTLDKYGCIDRMILDEEAVYGDLSNIKDLRSEIEKVEKAKDLWYNQPIEFREKFGNSIKDFMENGLKVVKQMIDEKTQSENNENTGDNNG